jgi:hypothetical protein
MHDSAGPTQQRHIKPALKRQLIDEAGGKCANPGCSNWRVHLHHIKHWAVYKAHNSAHMIAICPSCHDGAHHGQLKITEEALYVWKGLERAMTSDSAHVYVEPAAELKLLTGTLAISTKNEQMVVFELSNSNKLRLRVLDGDLLQVSSRLQNRKEKEVLRVVDNHVRVARDKNVVFDFRAGRARVSVPASQDYVPDWLIAQMRSQDPAFAGDGRVVAFDIEVLKPGLVRVEGFWPSEEGAIVITKTSLCLCSRGAAGPTSLVGEGESSVLMYAGPITGKLFGFR